VAGKLGKREDCLRKRVSDRDKEVKIRRKNMGKIDREETRQQTQEETLVLFYLLLIKPFKNSLYFFFFSFSNY
jgi:hypothetical protein